MRSPLALVLLLSASGLLLAASPARPQTPDAEPTMELVTADSEHQARVVERAMRTGFFVDLLLIPGTSYLGRLPWSKVHPNLQGTLRDARPGEPYLLKDPDGRYLVARRMPAAAPAVLGGRSPDETQDEIWAVLSAGPTDVRLLSLEVDVDTEDLAALCASKKRVIEDRLREARAKIEELPPDSPLPAVVEAHADLTSVLSFQGEMAEAIRAISVLAPRLPPGYRDILEKVLGIFELRRGEVENCVHQHNREMCLFPLSEAARHRVGDGARRAVGHFTRYLENHPDDLEVRWLLTIAAMTAGVYPEGIPERFRIPPEAFASPVDPGRFWDVAAPAGLAFPEDAGGTVVDDFDGDGLLDIVVSSRDPCEPMRFFKNRGDGQFTDETEAAGLTTQLGGLNLVQTDYDNDGRLDLFVMRGGWETAIRDSLLRNRPRADGGVAFEDVTAESGLGGPGHRTATAAWADYDGDGRLDLFVAHELSFSQLFRNRGTDESGRVTFEDATLAAGVRFRSMTKGATWGDVDNDGRPDLFVSNYGSRNLLFVNRGDGRFDEVARERAVTEPDYAFATWFWDYDNDGGQDLLVVNYLHSVDEVAREYLHLPSQAQTLRIYHNRGDGSFEDATVALGMDRMIPTMGANFGDLDNDGYLDVYLGTGAPSYGMLMPNRMFLNQGGRRFVDVTTATGTGHLQKGHGVAFADLDNDGDEDVFSNMGGAFPGDKYANALFENPGHGNDWIALRLVGTRSNRAAIGARIRVVLDEDGEEGQRVRWVTSGGSFGASPLLQHIGLGGGARILRIEIDWPASRTGERTRQVLRDVPINSFLVVTEGADGFELAPRRRFVLGSGEGAAHHAGH